ncbi:MAG: NifU family protein [Bacteroidota bacterium]
MTPITIYAELTPNPNSMKFVANVNLLEGGVVEYDSKEAAVNSPLAASLFSFSGITKVFITSNFITLTKDSEIDWFDVTNIIREFIRGFLMSGESLFIGSPFNENHVPAATKKNAEVANEKSSVEKEKLNIPTSPELEKKITELLEEYVKPAVEGDGGAIHFKSFENGTVSVVLKGACSGCPSSTITLKSGIENLLKRMLPEVQEVVAVSE